MGQRLGALRLGSGFDDSKRNPSYYAGGGMLRRYHFKLGATRLHADVGPIGFLMTREGFKDGDPFAGVLPAFSVGGKKVAVNITYIPSVDPKAVPLVFFQLRMKLGEFEPTPRKISPSRRKRVGFNRYKPFFAFLASLGRIAVVLAEAFDASLGRCQRRLMV